jgi:PPK2 family polyphosphate:nucleotide phosphotransferase
MGQASRLDHEPYLVPPGKKIKLKNYATDETGELNDKTEAKEALVEDISALADAQNLLFASKEYAVVIILQALDAAGKDGIIKHVMSGINPQGVSVYSFRAPNEEERLRHFLWRPARVLPAYGMIAIFNRSYYEEVLVVRVHPEFLDNQSIPRKVRKKGLDYLWRSRYEEINEFEAAVSEQNICLLKFFLHLSREEQRKRFLSRLDDPEKNWKFSAADVRERAFWDKYQMAYEQMLNATSTKAAPWHVIPADKKWFARACVADIIAHQIGKLNLKYPKLTDKEQAALAEARSELEAED